MEYKDLLTLALGAARADKNAPVCFSFGEEKYSVEQANLALANEFRDLCGYTEGKGIDYRLYRENQNMIFSLIEEVITDVLPKRVEKQYEAFAEVRTIPQGDKAVFHKRVTEAAKTRAKRFVTRVGLAGRYEVFMLDGESIEVKTSAIGYAARVGFEEFLDGRWQFSDFTDILLEGVDEYIYKEIAAALNAMISALPAANSAEVNGFDETVMDELFAIADSYGTAAIYCTREFAATMVPSSNWISNSMRDERWANGWISNYKGHDMIILDQSVTGIDNTTKVINPQYAYIIPVGTDKPVKLVFEGQTHVRTVDSNDDWSSDIQAYLKFGIATIASYGICSYKNTGLSTATRSEDDSE